MRNHLHDSGYNFSLGGTCLWLERILLTMTITYFHFKYKNLIIISTGSLLRIKKSCVSVNRGNLVISKPRSPGKEGRDCPGATIPSQPCLSVLVNGPSYLGSNGESQKSYQCGKENHQSFSTVCLHQRLFDKCKLTLEERLLAGAILILNSEWKSHCMLQHPYHDPNVQSLF